MDDSDPITPQCPGGHSVLLLRLCANETREISRNSQPVVVSQPTGHVTEPWFPSQSSICTQPSCLPPCSPWLLHHDYANHPQLHPSAAEICRGTCLHRCHYCHHKVGLAMQFSQLTETVRPTRCREHLLPTDGCTYGGMTQLSTFG